MTEPIVIDKNKNLLPAQDYNFLREKGIEYIQSLSGKFWTDHNLHDPGITILEILCYALTDLGYRTGFDIKDLLASGQGALTTLEKEELNKPENSGLFPAHAILTNHPLTLNDYRRLLLKIEGVRNAWLDPMNDPEQQNNYQESEISIYADCNLGQLSYEEFNALNDPNHRVRLSGLYKVLLELEIDDVLGSLNESLLVYQVKREVLKGVILSLDSQDSSFLEGNIDFSKDLAQILEVVSVTPDGTNFIAEVRIQLVDTSEIILLNLVIRVVNNKPKVNEDPVVIDSERLEAVLIYGESDGLIPLFWNKQQLRQKSLATVCCVLDAHRNLCEDFLSINTVEPERIAICVDIEVTSDADIEEVQAKVYHAIELYFNPPICYYTLQELLDAGQCADEIFNSPYIDTQFTCQGELVFTKPGFIKADELEESQLRRTIYVSDIINILMDFPEILSLKNVLLRKYNAEGQPIGNSEKWCLNITPNHQPILYIERSKILFFKNQIQYRARTAEFQQTLKQLRALSRKAAYVPPHQILDVPQGRDRETHRFFSVQHDFPKTYGIGVAGLKAGVTNLRVAQARQLKAYLTVYDQLLANYLAQLANVGKLFSLDQNLRQTYFSQYLSEIAGVRESFEDEFYLDKSVLQDDLQRDRLTENEELYRDRRNRLLDHLLARFAEQFTDYVLLMYRLDGDRLKTAEDLITDKIDFLREYPVISRDRYKAFNYRPEIPEQIWDTDNVSGLQKRISRLVGIDDYSRRNLSCRAVLTILFRTEAIDSEFRLEIRDAEDNIIFQSRERFPDVDQALSAAESLYPSIRQESSYTIDTSGGTGQVFYSINTAGVTLQNDLFFETEADAVQNIRALIGRYDEILLSEEACNDEGFHLIEHLLLRPFTNQDELIEVCLDANCEFCGEEDPYSFRIHVILPYWTKRFRSLDFRQFFERTLRQETPAHIHVRICWISNEQMAELDQTYRLWLEAKSVKDFDQAQLTNRLRELIQLLQRLKTVYSAATLHDCVEGEDNNPVRLGSTNLGNF